MSREPLLSVTGLVKSFGGLMATNHLDFDLVEGEIHGIIGPNGAGKTTFVSQLQGQLLPDQGKILLDGDDVTMMPAHLRARRGIARSFQITSLVPSFTALANVMLAVQGTQGHSFRFWKRAWGDARLTEPAHAALATVGLAAKANTKVADLSHGECRQLELAMALAMKPRLLLLDEPMAGMGRQDGAAMTDLVAELKGVTTIVLIEHDMEAVFRLADRISVLVAGRVIKTGLPEEVRVDEDVRAAYLGHSH
ncbi:ABC transporter ATP-binding protein [Pinisolibacter aquiterrae]|uniref:ABC transporter ATP-binding protein n=1 Tax=Pinisolibacter aquiterrae TaxID=2815579 RepID=UPI001C3D7257|nr:ABC transporter ATP-binding protein [Pinisolibacter aquiterrae]MBV5264939.1 ABC transporter ATP-binding protein [Pinisolibacter aquiterrae]MCC8237071.1 ABC transporter ATP-binding protein [Pinisolibacter aquiterrae]